MKAVFIVHNQALSEQIEQALLKLNIRGYSRWPEMQGVGSSKGEPHLGTHTWPALNAGVLTVVDDEKVEKLLLKLERINKAAEQQGLHAYIWNIERMI